jgi:hypothetical protein
LTAYPGNTLLWGTTAHIPIRTPGSGKPKVFHAFAGFRQPLIIRPPVAFPHEEARFQVAGTPPARALCPSINKGDSRRPNIDFKF